jgi:hypothetical protein
MVRPYPFDEIREYRELERAIDVYRQVDVGNDCGLGNGSEVTMERPEAVGEREGSARRNDVRAPIVTRDEDGSVGGKLGYPGQTVRCHIGKVCVEHDPRRSTE